MRERFSRLRPKGLNGQEIGVGFPEFSSKMPISKSSKGAAKGESGTPARTDGSMRKFNYRVPRFAVDIPIRLTFDETSQVGRCKEISTEGMRLEVRDPLAPDTAGTVHISYQGVALELTVRVAHSSSSHEGVRFVYETDEQRDEVIRLVALLSGRVHQGPMLLQ